MGLKVLVLFSLLGVLAAEYAFTPGREYVYLYRTRTVTGIPGLKPQYAGMGIEGTLRLQVESPSVMLAKLSNLRVGTVNDEMRKPWREEFPISYSPLGEAQEPLNLPFKIILKSGVVQSLEVSNEEPEWSVNIKKGIASQLTLNMAKINLVPSKIHSNIPYSSSEYRFLNTITAGTPVQNFYTVEEDSIGGECKTSYTIAPLPEYLAKLEELSLPEEWRKIRTETEEGKAWIVTKIRNYNQCKRKPFYTHNSFIDISPEPCSMADAQCKRFTSRSSVSRYLVRGDRQNFKIERVWTEGELLVRPFATKTEKLWVVTNQTLVLEKMSSISSRIPNPPEPRPTSLLFSFPNSRYEIIKEMNGELTNPDSNVESFKRSSYEKEYKWEPEYNRRFERNVEKNANYGFRSESNEEREYESKESYGSKYGSRYGSKRPYPKSEYEREYPYRKESSYKEDTSSEVYEEKYRKEYPEKYEREYTEEYSPEYESLRRNTYSEEEYVDEPHWYNPHSYIFYNYSRSSSAEPEMEKIKSQIKHLLTEVETEIEAFQDLAAKDSSLKILQVSRALSLLPYREVKELYEELISSAPVVSPYSKKTMKTLFLDAVAMSGTSPAVKLIKELILKKEVTGETAAQLIMVLPATIKVPTVNLLKELISLAKSPVIRPHSQPRETRQVYVTALLAVSNLINKVCVNPKTRIFNYPITRKGLPSSSTRFCSPDSPLITEVWLPFLEQELRNAAEPNMQIPILKALGNTGHPFVLRILKPYIYGSVTPDVIVRSKSIYGAMMLAKKYPSLVFSLMKPIFHNPSEHYAVRIPAFYTLMKCHPPAAFFTAVATGTWFEPSQQVGSFVYSTLASLANSSYPIHANMSRFAEMAVVLAKPYDLGIQYSHNIYNTWFLREWEMGTFLETAWVGSNKSLFPRDFYVKVNKHMGGFETMPFEFDIHSEGIQKVFNKVFGPMGRYYKSESMFDMFSRIKRNIRSEFSIDELRNLLPLETRKDDPFLTTIRFKLMNTMERIFTFDKNTITHLMEEGTIRLNSPGEYGINYQKVIPLDESTVVLPSVMGLPIMFTLRTPVLVSLRGTVKLEISPSMFRAERSGVPNHVRVYADVKPMISYNNLIETVIVCPLTTKALISGVNSHVLVSLPLKANAVYDIPEGKIKIELEKPTHGPLPSEIDLFHIHSKPFTAVKPLLNFTPVTLFSGTKMIHTQHAPQVMETRFGQKSLGLPLRFVQKIDRPFIGMPGVYKLFHNFNWLTMMEYVLMPTTLKQYEYKLLFERNVAETSKIVAHFSYDESDKAYKTFSYEPEMEFERMKYKYPSKYYNKYSEDVMEYFRNPWSKLAECEDPESPCYTSYDSIRNLRSKEYYTPMKYEDMDIESGKFYKLHAEVELEGRVPRRYRASVIYATSKTNIREKLSVLMEREPLPGYESTPYKICINSKFQYPNLPRSTERQTLLQSDMTTLGNLHFRFGEECQHAINTRIVMTRTEKQRMRAEESYESHRCREDESRGIKYSPVCKKARIQATTLNSYILDITEENVPFYVKNFTYHVDDFLKYMLYPYMTNRRVGVSNPSNKVKVVLKVFPPESSHPYPVLDVFLLKPRENTYFKTIKVSPTANIAFPLSAKQELVKKTLNRIFGLTYIPECKLESEYVRTFDNVTYKYPLGECWHLLAKDCSKEAPVAVLAKESSSFGKMIKVLVGPHKVLIKPMSRVSAVSGSVPEIQVLLDGEPVHLSPTEKKVIKSPETPYKKILEFIKYKNHEIEVESPLYGVKVVTDGERIKVEVSNIYRGRMCGLCGDFNGEKVAEFKTPRECVMVHPLAFAQTYAIKEGGCSMHSYVKHIVPEEHKCLRADTYYPMGTYHEMESPEYSESSSSCTRYMTKVVPRGDETCFSVKPVPECSLSCTPSNIVTKEVGFHCVSRGHHANELMARARYGVLEEMLAKSIDFTAKVAIHESCRNIEA